MLAVGHSLQAAAWVVGKVVVDRLDRLAAGPGNRVASGLQGNQGVDALADRLVVRAMVGNQLLVVGLAVGQPVAVRDQT